MASIDPYQLRNIALQIVASLTTPSGLYPIVTQNIRGINQMVFNCGPWNLAELFMDSMTQNLDKTFLVFLEERYTYGDVLKCVEALRHVMVKRGVKKGDFIGIAMRNFPEWCFTFIAATLIGAVPVALHSLWTAKELEYGIIDSGISLLVCDHERFKRAIPTLKQHRRSISCILVRAPLNEIEPEWKSRVFAWEDIIKEGQGNKIPPVDIHPEDTAAVMYTSGSTGHPKGVVLTHRCFVNYILTMWLGMEVRDRMMPPTTSLQPSIILSLPLFHVTALNHVFLVCISKGMKMVMLPKWDPAVALSVIEKEKITYIIGVPTMTQDIMEHPNFSKTDLSSLLQVGGGGSATPPSLVSKMISKFPLAQPGQGYGLTETTGGIASNTGPMYSVKPRSTGPPAPLVKVKVVDLETGQEVPTGCRGELLIKSVVVMKEYLNKPVETSKAIISVNGDPGWFRTGDVVELDQDGYIYIVDRAKDIIIRGGENISCGEVESAFYQHPFVMECAAVPVAHPRLGEVVGLVVVPKAGYMLNVEELISSVKGKLANFKIPENRFIFISSTPLPRGGTDKINKLALRQLLAALTGKL